MKRSPKPRAGNQRRSLIPGFGLTMGTTLLYTGLIVVLPVAVLFLSVAGLGLDQVLEQLTTPRALAAFRLSFGAALLAAAINCFFGLLVAWALIRYQFPGKEILDAMVDLPFALPTAVSGITLTTLFSQRGWFGSILAEWGVTVNFTQAGIVLALVFIGIPFAVRTLQPALTELDLAQEEAAASLGASRWQTFIRVVFPNLLPALLAAFGLAFARAIGEYGSVIFIAGNMPMKTEIVPLLIVIQLEQYNMAGATVLGLALLVASLVVLTLVQGLQRWGARRAMGGVS